MLDALGRKIEYLRISVTDKCNLRCIYCMPIEGVQLIEHSQILTFEEISQIVRSAAELGINSIRITGGEPLVRKNLSSLIFNLSEIPHIKDISLTTNGTLLPRLADELYAAGLRRINISLDTLQDERYTQITRLGDFDSAWKGIEKAIAVGFSPIKINVVVMENLNFDEIDSFINLAKIYPLHIRFIELMPMSVNKEFVLNSFSSLEKIKQGVVAIAQPIQLTGKGPAMQFAAPGWKGSVGFIDAISHGYCGACNRLRLTADGILRTCLHGTNEINIREVVRLNPDLLTRVLREAIKSKVEKFQGESFSDRAMSQIGG